MDWLSENSGPRGSVWPSLLGVAEMFSLDLILIMLAVGRVAGMVAGLRSGPRSPCRSWWPPATSVATLALVRPTLVKRLHGGPDLQVGHGKLVGKQGVVTERITGLEVGRVKVGGEIWSAAPYDETLIIEPGETVEVFEIRGATAYVHPMPTPRVLRPTGARTT